MDRFTEVPTHGLFCDLLWSDPVENEKASEKNFTTNKERQCSIKFGLAPLNKVLKNTKMSMVLRGHQVKQEGFEFHNWEGSNVPSLVTVFSAANYCDVYKNRGAVILISQNNFNVQGYNSHPAPYYLPKKKDLFMFSMKFLGTKILDIFEGMLNKACENMSDDSDDEKDGELLNEVHEVLDK